MLIGTTSTLASLEAQPTVPINSQQKTKTKQILPIIKVVYMTEISLYVTASIHCIVNMYDTYQTLEKCFVVFRAESYIYNSEFHEN